MAFPGAPTAQPRILEVSGDDQRGAITSTLPLPLVVRLVDAGGAPVANHAVTYEVIQNNGSLSAGQATARVLTVQTNAQGQASVSWHLGARSGAGNNRVRAHASGFAGAVEFDATATSGAPSMIVVDAGSNQIGALGSILPRPLMTVVVDSGNNRIAGVPVTFSVIEGNATFDGSPAVVVTTDSDGRAWATPTLGDARDNTFTASIAVGDAAVFVATGKAAGLPSQTRISGVVLDNQNQPIAGVSMRVEGTSLFAQTGDHGQFTIAGAPVGYVKLIADGSTALRSGTWPTLEYAVFTIAGQNNTLEMPVYLLPIDVRRGVFVDEVTGGTLTIPELPGFALTIAPGSATFPGGSRTGTVSATLVHADKVPMAPGFGQQPRFIVTIQPPGVHFDPPAALTIPNADGLTPGQVTEMYSFDHDLGQFVSIGTGAVSEDGTVVTSDPGVGIIKGGWHCGGDPTPTGASASCPECKKCNGSICVTNPAKEGQPCTDDGNPETQDVCEDGTCKHKPVSVAIGGPGPSASAMGGIAALAAEDFRNMWVLRDDPTKHWDDAVPLTAGQPVWGNPGLGSDYLLYRAYVTPASMRTHVTNYRWKAVGPETITGPGGPSATQWTFNTGVSWDPGDYSITLEVTFDTGVTKTTTYKQRVGLRTDDVLVIGWINKAGVSVNPDGVYWAVLEIFPPEGLCDASALRRAAAFAYLGTLTAGGDARPFGPPDNFLSPADRRYILNWMFKHGGSPGAPPPLFFNEEQVQDFKEEESLYKLYNRAQVKYFVEAGKITAVNRLKQDTRIGVTTDPITCAFGVSGEPGIPWNGKFVVRDTEIHQINDGTPDSNAVAAFNTLLFPLKWNHIGSKIQFSLAAGIAGDVKNQVYPTYSIFNNKSLMSVRPQAPEPSMNFSLNPFPPGPPFPPYIIPD